jgi:hypothetical protein
VSNLVICDGGLARIGWWIRAPGIRGLRAGQSRRESSREEATTREEPEVQACPRRQIHRAGDCATLNSGDWQQPFTPFMKFGGRRSILPSDLTDEQKTLVARIAPLIEQPSLRARVADVAWFYGERSKTDLVDLAIDGYTAMPLTVDVWYLSTISRT